MRRAIAIVGCAIVCACAPRTIEVIGEIPDDLDWIGVVFFDANGEVSGATGLSRWSPGASVEGLHQLDERGASSVAVLGYLDSNLAQVLPGAEVEARLREHPLQPANANDPPLPLPAYAATAPILDAQARLEPGMAPVLTADWLPPCPRIAPAMVDPDVFVELCTSQYCAASITQSGCTLQADWSRCVPDFPEQLAVDGRGAVSADGCRVLTPKQGATFAIECKDCRIDTYFPPAPDRFEVTRVLARPESPPTRLGVLRRPLVGYLQSLAITASCPTERALVIVDEDAIDHGCNRGQEILQIDVADPTRMSRTAVPGSCMRHLVADPIGGGALAIFGFPIRIGRIDCDGTLGALSPLDAPEIGERIISDVALVEDDAGRPELAIALRFEVDTPGATAQIMIVDPQTLMIERFVGITNGQNIIAIASAGPGKLMASIEGSTAEFHSRVAIILHTDPAALPLAFETPNEGQLQARIDYLSALDDRWLAGSVWNGTLTYPALRVFAADGYRGTGNEYTQFGSPSASHSYYETGTALVPITTEVGIGDLETDPITSVGLFDPADRHFLPGRAKIGWGPVSAVDVDSSGAHWMALTWEGAIARVAAR